MDDFLEKYELVGGKVRQVLPGSSGAAKLETLRRAMAGDDEAGIIDPETKKSRIKAFMEETRARDLELEDRESDEDFPMPSIVGMGKDKDRWDVETILSECLGFCAGLVR